MGSARGIGASHPLVRPQRPLLPQRAPHRARNQVRLEQRSRRTTPHHGGAAVPHGRQPLPAPRVHLAPRRQNQHRERRIQDTVPQRRDGVRGRTRKHVRQLSACHRAAAASRPHGTRRPQHASPARGSRRAARAGRACQRMGRQVRLPASAGKRARAIAYTDPRNGHRGIYDRGAERGEPERPGRHQRRAERHVRGMEPGKPAASRRTDNHAHRNATAY